MWRTLQPPATARVVSAAMLTLEELREDVAAGAVDTVIACFTDMQGRLMGKRLDAEFFLAEKDRKSTRLNSSHMSISYAVFCLKKKKTITETVYYQYRCSTWV